MRIGLFLSTPSAGRATRGKRLDETEMPISIHALRGEGDNNANEIHPASRNFYPRPPRGGRLSDTADTMGDVLISIHALRGEGDRCLVMSLRTFLIFLSTPSAGRATG